MDAGAVWQLHCVACATVLAGSAGIRATVPLFVLSALHQLNAQWATLSPQTEWLGHWYICCGLFALLVVEVIADAIPAVDHALHAFCAPIYPIAGACAAAAPNYGGGIAMHALLACVGAGLAMGAHGGKSALRAISTATTGGAGNICLSFGGTLGVVVAVCVAIFAVIFSVILAVVMVVGIVYSLRLATRTADRVGLRRAAVPVLAAVRFRRAAAQGVGHTTPLSPSIAMEEGGVRTFVHAPSEAA